MSPWIGGSAAKLLYLLWGVYPVPDHLLSPAFLLYTTAIRIFLCLCETPLNKDSRDRLSDGVHGVGSMH